MILLISNINIKQTLACVSINLPVVAERLLDFVNPSSNNGFATTTYSVSGTSPVKLTDVFRGTLTS